MTLADAWVEEATIAREVWPTVRDRALEPEAVVVMRQRVAFPNGIDDLGPVSFDLWFWDLAGVCGYDPDTFAHVVARLDRQPQVLVGAVVLFLQERSRRARLAAVGIHVLDEDHWTLVA